MVSDETEGECMTDENQSVASASFVLRCGWKMHHWATIRCGNSSERMLGFWCWVLDRIETLFGEPPETKIWNVLIDAWLEANPDDDEDTQNPKPSSDRR